MSFKKYLKKPRFIIGAVIVLIILFIVFGRRGSGSKFETATAVIGNVIETVSVTGTVSPVDKADLSFEKGGVITRIYVKVGDQVRVGDKIASLDSAGDTANYQSAAATLADISRSLRPEEQTVEKTKVATAQSAAVNAAHDAYVSAQGALVSYTDSLFTNAGSINPTINVQTDSYMTKVNIQNERIAVNQALSDWTADLQSSQNIDPATLVARAQNHLLVVKAFVKDLSTIVGSLTTVNSGLSQTAVNSYTTIVNSALSAVNQATDSLTTAASNLSQAISTYTLKVAGNSSDSIAAQQAKVNQAAAELAKDTIIAPINGIITKVSPNEGEFVPAGQSQFSVQSIGNYKIEANVPEADIAKIALGDYSSTTLDAYGSDTYFGAKVIAIDPAETVIEGVPTYKVTLYFTDKDDRIRSGMTANLEILTHERDRVVTIPYRAVIDESGAKSVRILDKNSSGFATTSVMTGLKGSDGTIEILSGIIPGQKVITYIK